MDTHQQPSIHPAVRPYLGKAPVGTEQKPAENNQSQTSEVKVKEEPQLTTEITPKKTVEPDNAQSTLKPRVIFLSPPVHMPEIWCGDGH